MAWTEQDDNRVREMMKTGDPATMTNCPKCGIGSDGGSDLVLGMGFCTHKYCPLREYRDAKVPDCEFCRDAQQKYVMAPNGEYMHRAVHGCEIVWNACKRRAPWNAEFVRESGGAIVAEILEDGDNRVEVQKHANGTATLTIHRLYEGKSYREDMSVTLKPQHFRMLGSIADQLQ